MRSLSALVLTLGCSVTLFAAAPPARLPAEVPKWIDQLGDDDEDKRKQAEKKLDALGPAVLPALREAAKSHDDVDVRLRAVLLAAAIARRSSGEVRVFQGHASWVLRVVVLSDGKHAISSGGNVLRLWDLETGKMVRVVAKTGGWALSVSDDGGRVATAFKGERASVFDVKSGKLIGNFAGHGNQVWTAALSPDGKRLFTGGNTRGQHLYDVDTGKPAVEGFKGANDYCRCATWSADGSLLAAGHFDLGAVKGSQRLWPGTLRLWDAKTGKERWQAKGHEREITSVSFSPDGKRLVTSSLDKTVRVYNTADGKELLQLTAQGGPIEGAALSRDGKRVITVSNETDPTVRVWDIESKKEVRRLDGHDGGSLSVAVTKDGKHILSTGRDKTLRLWTMPK